MHYLMHKRNAGCIEPGRDDLIIEAPAAGSGGTKDTNLTGKCERRFCSYSIDAATTRFSGSKGRIW